MTVCFSRQGFSDKHSLSYVQSFRFFFYSYEDGHSVFLAGGNKSHRRADIFGQRISGIVCNLVFNGQLGQVKMVYPGGLAPIDLITVTLQFQERLH